MRVYRDNLKEQALENSREKTRIRVAKHCALKKAQGIISKKEPPKTRAAQEKREYWRNKKREERRRTPREQKEVNKKRREQRRCKALQDAARKENKLRQNAAQKKTLQKALQKMPASSKVCDIIKHLVFSASPNTKRRLSNSGITSSSKKESFLGDTADKIKTVMKSLQKKRNKADLQKKRIITAAISLKKKYVRQQMKHLGLGYKLIRKSSLDTKRHRKKRCDSLDFQTVKQVEEFYNRGDISRDLPDARSATKTAQGHVVGRKVLECTVKSAYAQFCKENGGKKMAFTTL